MAAHDGENILIGSVTPEAGNHLIGIVRSLAGRAQGAAKHAAGGNPNMRLEFQQELSAKMAMNTVKSLDSYRTGIAALDGGTAALREIDAAIGQLRRGPQILASGIGGRDGSTAGHSLVLDVGMRASAQFEGAGQKLHAAADVLEFPGLAG
ncbi:MAG: hypothetical protein JWM25_1897 [Thermoleophilia bacterium]|nr:hypothetical protein [Thermoleophilia bacterium]MCZ4497312.1 hypothetical protein [Thermoleophilia bacterium]